MSKCFTRGKGGKSSAVLDPNISSCEPSGLGFIPEELLFGTIIIGEQSDTVQKLTVTNQGKSSIQIRGVTITDGAESFSLVGNTLYPEYLAGGKSFDIEVAVVPGTSGNLAGTLEIETNEDRISYVIGLSARQLESGSLNNILQQAYGYFDAKLQEESWARANGDEAEAGHRLTLEASMEGFVRASVTQEAIARSSADQAEASERLKLAADVRGEFAAGLEAERIARADAISAEASSREAMEASLRDNITASVESERSARVTAMEAEAQRVDNLLAEINTDVNVDQKISAAISAEASARATAIEAEASSRESLAAQIDNRITDDVMGSITTEREARVTAYNSLVQTFNLLGSVNGDKSAFLLDANKTFVTPSQSLSSRLSSIDSAIDGAAASASDYAQAIVDNALGSIVTRTSVLEASRSNALNKNALFSVDGYTSGVPYGWNNFVNGNLATLSDHAANNGTKPIKMPRPAGQNAGFSQTISGLPAGWYVIDVEVELGLLPNGLGIGPWEGAGIYVDFHGNIDYRFNFGNRADISGLIYNGNGYNRRFFSFLVNNPSQTDCNLYMMAGWNELGNISQASEIHWHRCLIRPATAGEIDSQKALADAGTANANAGTALTKANDAFAAAAEAKASVVVQSGAITDLYNRNRAWWEVAATAGDGRASLRIAAENNGGKVEITGDVLINGSLVTTGSINGQQKIIPNTITDATSMAQFAQQIQNGGAQYSVVLSTSPEVVLNYTGARLRIDAQFECANAEGNAGTGEIRVRLMMRQANGQVVQISRDIIPDPFDTNRPISFWVLTQAVPGPTAFYLQYQLTKTNATGAVAKYDIAYAQIMAEEVKR